MNKINEIKLLLRQYAELQKKNHAIFFKTGSGHYAEHERFLGVDVPSLRKISKTFYDLSLEELQILIESPFNEERLLALFILTNQYIQGDEEKIYQFYLLNLRNVNNWNLVDASAHLIIGKYLFKQNKDLLLKLVLSEIMWERRIAIVSTWYFIRNNDLEWTFKLATMLLNDPHDLIHKATGWMLREAGKKDQNQLLEFLDKYTKQMPRTMLRYAIEKLDSYHRNLILLK